MFIKIQQLLFKSGFITLVSFMRLIHAAPLYIQESPTNISNIWNNGTINSILAQNKTAFSDSVLSQEPYSSEIPWVNISDGQSLRQKQIVVNYLSALEEREEKENNISSLKSISTAIPYIFEEDIILTPHQAQVIYEARNPRQKRKLSTDLQRHWQLPIEYTFDGTHNETHKTIIRRAIHYWESFTCITFTEFDYKTNLTRNENQTYLLFTTSEGCWSFVGRSTYKQQKVSVTEECMYEGHVLHELGHVIGFWHEHARPDRDDYISVQQNAIKSGKQYNFLHISWKDLDTKDMPYDVGSIMHYGSTAYSIENTNPVQPTILTKDPLLQRALGQRFQLSYYDAKLANMAYCSDVCNKTELAQPCQNDGYQDPKQCSRCRCSEGLGGQYCETAAPSVGDTCGGTLNIQGSPLSFGHHGAYRFGQQCNWYFKAPKENRIFFAIESANFMEYEGCSSDPYIECLNYVEVRYSHNVAKTGARLCCSYRPSSKPIISEGNEMLVLMKANQKGPYGFQAKVWAEPCGGCLSGTELSHQPCSRQVSYVCQHEWNYTMWNPCPSGNWWWADNKDCNKLVSKTASRSGICQKSELFCCYGYTLNGTTCVKSNVLTTTHVIVPPDTSSTEYSVPTGSPSVGKENDPVSGWGNWTTWSNCSQPCGGCGNQTRQRFCYDPLRCSGKSVEVESKACNILPCYSTNIGTRNKAVVKVCYTNPITLELQKCTVYEKETYTYVTETCCAGYSKNTTGSCTQIIT